MRSAVCIAALFAGSLAATDPDLTDYKTVAQAIPARTAKAGPATTSRPAYLGLYLVIDSKSLVVADVAGAPRRRRRGSRSATCSRRPTASRSRTTTPSANSFWRRAPTSRSSCNSRGPASRLT